MITKPKNKKVLIGIIAAVILLLGLVFGIITIAGNTPGRRADKYLDLGDKYLSELNYEQALVAYRQVLEIEPKNLAAYKGGLAAYAGLGDCEGMAELYIDALGVIEGLTEQEQKPVYDIAVEIYLYADTVYPEDHEAAAQALERGYDTLGRDEQIIRALIAEYGILAGVYIDAGDYEREQEIYRKIVEKNLENEDALSEWEQRVRELFQEYLSKNGGSGKTQGSISESGSGSVSKPEVTSEPTAEPTAVPASAAFGLKGTVQASGEYMGLSWQVTDARELVVTGHMEGDGLDSGSIWTEAPWTQYGEHIVSAYMSFTGAISLQGLFANYTSLSEVNLSGLDTSNVTDMSSMFRQCRSLENLDLSSFDTSNVTNMSFMFAGCEYVGESWKGLDLSSFDTSKVTDMSYMFAGCGYLDSQDLRNFDTGNVTDMTGMFMDCGCARGLDLSSFDTSHVTNMSYMFWNCSGLNDLNLSNFDTRNVKDMSYMFAYNEFMWRLDLRSFDMGSVTNMHGMFKECYCDILTGDNWDNWIMDYWERTDDWDKYRFDISGNLDDE